MENIFNQSPYQCRMDWGTRGVLEASKRGDIIILVDILSFSSAVTSAVHHGVIIYPFTGIGDINEFGEKINADVCLLDRMKARELNLPSLSITSFNESHKDKKYVVSSINGATCVSVAGENDYIFLGCLLNSTAVAKTANQVQEEKLLNITVIASGERWSSLGNEPKELRPNIEDYLGAGAILELLNGTKSPEAKVCISSYQNSKKEIVELIKDSSTGREVINMGFPEDVEFSSQVGLFNEVPILTKDNKGYSYFKNYLSNI